MIKQPIAYTAASQNLLDSCDFTTLKSTDWADDKYKDIKTEIKEYYKKVQNFTCPYCKQKFNLDHNSTWDIEHIIPRDSKPEFMFVPINLCVACKDCNGPKSNKNVLLNKNRKTIPKKPIDYLIVHPHLHIYEDHIEVVVLGELYRPLTDNGKFTVIACDLVRFYKYTPRDSVVFKSNLCTELAKKVAFSATKADQEKAEKDLLEYLQLKHGKISS